MANHRRFSCIQDGALVATDDVVAFEVDSELIATSGSVQSRVFERRSFSHGVPSASVSQHWLKTKGFVLGTIEDTRFATTW